MTAEGPKSAAELASVPTFLQVSPFSVQSRLRRDGYFHPRRRLGPSPCHSAGMLAAAVATVVSAHAGVLTYGLDAEPPKDCANPHGITADPHHRSVLAQITQDVCPVRPPLEGAPRC